MQKNLMLRYRAAMSARKYFDAQGFIDIETPTLYKSTPEGAREFLVPSRVHHGMFYALPQSPQLFKQMLMMAGFDRYYQICKCYRDEDLRADRQPEFTQIDVETSFLSEHEIREIMEGLVRTMFKEALDVELPDPFPVMTFADAMRDYGSDKPDLRVPLKLTELTDLMQTVDFKVFRAAADLPDGRVAALCVPGGGTLSRKEIDDYAAFVTIYGAQGLAYIKVNDATKPNDEGLQSPIVKFLTSDVLATIIERTGAASGDLIFFGAGKDKVVNDALGALRAKVGHDRGLVQAGWRPLWVVDFPMFEYDEAAKTWAARHHPFTAPKDGHEALLATDPGNAIAKAYDVVLNGWEIGGGSVRIHRQDVQARGVRGAEDQPRGPAQEVRLPARCAAVRRAAAWRDRLRSRSHGHADGRRRIDPRRHRLPEDAARPGSAGRCAERGDRAAVARSAHPGPHRGRDQGCVTAVCVNRVRHLLTAIVFAACAFAPAAHARATPTGAAGGRPRRTCPKEADAVAARDPARRSISLSIATASSSAIAKSFCRRSRAAIIIEYTVPTPGRQGPRRAAHRLRRPKNKHPTACYYTDDHYRTFRRIRE